MKRFLIIVFYTGIMCSANSQNWTTVNKTSPDYSFALPSHPNIMDTMNIRLAWLRYDSLTLFQVLEFKETPLDSANLGFIDALGQNSGDTLLALAQTIANSNNSVITNSVNINSFSNYKGLEISMKYNDLSLGKVLLVYIRFFYNTNTLISFSITGIEDNISQLQADKTLFFNSISM